jgi:hypothetical protein
MEKTTSFLRLLAALFSATAAGLLLAQRIKESVRQAEAEIREEDRAVDGIAKLQDLMDKTVKGDN